MGARSYDARTGRFAQRDPLPPVAMQRGDATYLYGSANPGVLADPTGLRPDAAPYQVGQLPSGCPIYDPPDLEEMYQCDAIVQRKWERYIDAVARLGVMIRMQSENLYAYQHPAMSVGEIYEVGAKCVGAAAVLVGAVSLAIWTSGASIPGGLVTASFIIGGTAVGLSALNAAFTCTRDGWSAECGGAVALASIDLLLFGTGEVIAGAASETIEAASMGRHLTRAEVRAMRQEASALSILSPTSEVVREAGEELSEHFLPGIDVEEAMLGLEAPDPDLAMLADSGLARALQLDLAFQGIRNLGDYLCANMVPAPPMPGW
jgi:hypothetical protein